VSSSAPRRTRCVRFGRIRRQQRTGVSGKRGRWDGAHGHRKLRESRRDERPWRVRRGSFSPLVPLIVPYDILPLLRGDDGCGDRATRPFRCLFTDKTRVSRIWWLFRYLLPRAFAHSRTLALAPPSTRQVVTPINGDPFIGMLETPVTSSPLVANYLSSLPAYRTGVSPLLRGVEIGLAHGFLIVGPFIKLGPLRDFAGESGNAGIIAGCLSGAGLVLILTMCLSMYGQVTFQNEVPSVGVKTLSGRSVAQDALQTSEGWQNFAAGWTVGGLSGVAWGYVCTQILPYYQ